MKNFKFFIILTLSFNYSCDNLTNKAPKCSDESVKNEAIKIFNESVKPKLIESYVNEEINEQEI